MNLRVEDFLDDVAPMEGEVSSEHNPSPEEVLAKIPESSPPIHRERLRDLLYPSHAGLMAEREVLNPNIPQMSKRIKAHQTHVNTVLERLERQDLIFRQGRDLFLRRPGSAPGGELARIVAEASRNKQETVVTGSRDTLKEVVTTTVQRRKTARDVDLEDHLRLNPTATITASSLIGYFAIQGAADPRATANQRLARLVLLGILKRVGPANSGVYMLVPESSS